MTYKGLWAGYSPAAKFFLAIGVVLLSTVFFSVFSIVLASLIFHVNIMEIETLLTDLDHPLTLAILQFVQAFSTIGTFIMPAFLLGWLFQGNATNYLKLNKSVATLTLLSAALLFLAYMPLINYLGELNSHISLPPGLQGLEEWMRDSEEKAARLTEKFLMINSPLDFILTMIIIAVLPAIGEELLFRGVIQRIFIQWSRNVHVGIWTSAILFSALHMQFLGFVPRMMLGVMLGYLFYWSGSLWLPMFVHFLNNGAAVVFTYLYKKGDITVDTDKVGTGDQVSYVLLSTLITALLMWSIYKNERKAIASG